MEKKKKKKEGCALVTMISLLHIKVPEEQIWYTSEYSTTTYNPVK